MRLTAAAAALIAFFAADFSAQHHCGPGLPGPAIASAQTGTVDFGGIPGIPRPLATETEPALSLEPLERISGPPLLSPKLDELTHMDFVDVPLSVAAEFLRDLHAIPVVLDAQALKDVGFDTDLPITITIQTPDEFRKELGRKDITPDEIGKLHEQYADQLIPLHQGLNLMLSPYRLSWYVEDDVLHITTLDVEHERQLVRSYSVRHLLRSGITPDSLIDAVQSMTRGLWEDTNGAGGTLSVVGQVLTVRQSFQVQRQVESLLAALSHSSAWQYVEYPRRHVRQLELLEQPIDEIKFVDAPLKDAIEFMGELVGTTIRIDEAALEDEGIVSDEPVSLQLPMRPLRTALKLVLEPLQLTTIVKDGMLTVTTATEAEDEDSLHTVVYDVRELDAATVADDAAQSRVEAVVEAIQNTTDPWLNIDGSGGELALPGGGRMVVRNTDRVHAEIRRLLAAQRRLLQEPETEDDAPAQPPRGPVETRFYRVPTESAEDLLSAIPALVAVETWQHLDALDAVDGMKHAGTIRKVDVGSRVIERRKGIPQNGKPGDKPAPEVERTVVKQTVLIIRNTRSVHTQIDDFLRDLGLNVFGVLKGKGAPGTGGGFF